jgi:adenylate kinase family enzyme
MVLIFCGPSGSGKSTAARIIAQKINAKIYAGKDYLRLAKNENQAWNAFKALLITANEENSNVIYVLAEVEKINDVGTIPGAYIIRFMADLDVLQKRFLLRTKDVSPQIIARMIEIQVHQWQNIDAHYIVDTTSMSEKEIVVKIEEYLMRYKVIG